MADSNWVRQRLLYKFVDVNADAGTNIHTCCIVPDNCCFVLTHICAYNKDTDMTEFTLWIDDHNDDMFQLLHKLTPGANVTIEWDGKVVMESGDYIETYFQGCAANDNIYLYVYGYYIPQFKALTPDV